MLILSLLHMRSQQSVFLSDLVTVIAFTALSWPSIVFMAYNRLYDWMIQTDHDKLLWHNHDD